MKALLWLIFLLPISYSFSQEFHDELETILIDNQDYILTKIVNGKKINKVKLRFLEENQYHILNDNDGIQLKGEYFIQQSENRYFLIFAFYFNNNYNREIWEVESYNDTRWILELHSLYQNGIKRTIPEQHQNMKGILIPVD